MNIREYQQYDALGLADLVRKKEVSPTELLKTALMLVERTQRTVNAVAHVDPSLGERNAKQNGNGIFGGVPFLVKELLSYPGLPMSMGSRLFATHVPPIGSEYSTRIAESGLVTFGNSTSSEFGLLGSTETLLHGITRNPWNTDFSATGSSGGSAAAVAAGIVPMAHASDGGGSIRIPASACGLFGLMPSAGRCVPANENGGPFSDLVIEHCISKTVRDSAALLSATEDRGTSSRRPKFTPIGNVSKAKSKRLRIGIYTKPLVGVDVESDVSAVVEKTRRLCEELGHATIQTDGPTVDGKAVSLAFFTLAGFTLNQVCVMMASMLSRRIDENFIEPFTFQLVQWFRTLDSDAVSSALEVMKSSADRMLQFSSQYDVLLCPTMTSQPKPLGYLSPTLDRQTLIERTEFFAGYTPIHNISGMCAMSVPLFISSSGLPIGSHFAAKPGDEKTLIELAYQLEDAAPWIGRLPLCNTES